MINKDQIQNIRIKRLRIIFPLIALVIVSLIFFQSINIATTKDKNLNLILSDQSNDGVLKPSMIGETSSGQPFVLNALKASPLGPDLRDIELENVSITLGKEGVQTISVNSRNAKYFAKNNIAIFFDDIVSKTSDGYDFIAQVVNVNLETGFTFLNGPVQGRKGEIEFDAGHVEIHERGNKIFISSGVKLIIPASFIKQINEE
ncbi:MAG: LPS export ABC transporter periplasmic protein LptC [Pseudomonadota bacterium]|nr:LPS export ABC transporter periplasmic protein LptC [Pseudomonadota bacterium]MEC8019621.1 LPS export ABC transporter periplasmic protein LptC [Pseudomonadota bacterium]|tara:strand:+ start:199 stop:807 length:609 start_codon:yes stop_codon:yes gene_type:complete